MAFTLSDSDPKLLPASISEAILSKAFEQSVVGRLSPSKPMTLGENVIPVYEGGIEAGVVGEGEAKPVSTPTMSAKVIKPIKLATIVVVSEEAARVNPGQMLTHIQDDMSNAITRAIDLGVLHGRSAKTGAAIPDQTFVNQTTNRVDLGAGDLGPQIMAGYALAAEEKDPNGFAFDTRMRPALVSSTDGNGNSVFQAAPDLSRPIDNVWGLPAAYGRAVSGRIGASADTDVKGFVGDWSQIRWGYAQGITLKRSTEATVVDGETVYNLWQMNLIGLLVEATVGWAVVDTEAFAAYDDAA